MTLDDEDIIKLAQHAKLYPEHGLDCRCMDDYIRKVKRELKRQMQLSKDMGYVNRVRLNYIYTTALRRM